jgi:hypothetical protein
MNRKGIMTSIWFGIFIFLVGIVFINFLMPDVSDARIALDCSNAAGISDGNKMVCLLVDVTVPYWIMLVISVMGGVILDRVLQ